MTQQGSGRGRALVIGSTGFLGSWLVDRLVRDGAHVTGVSRGNPIADTYLKLRPAHVHFGHGLSEYLNATPSSLDHFDVVYYLAGRASVPESIADPHGDLLANVAEPVRLLDALRRLKSTATFVYTSSAAVYGSATNLPMPEGHPLLPVSPYGVAKLSGEMYVDLFARSFGLHTVSARLFSVYGPGQAKQVVYDTLSRVAGGETPLSMLGNPDVSRDFIYVADAVEALAAIGASARAVGETYNVGSGRETTLGELAAMVLDVAGGKSVEFTGSVRDGDPVRWQADIGALRALGHSPRVSLLEGLKCTYDWLISRQGPNPTGKA